MLKYDSCYHMGRVGTPSISFNRFKAMSDALKSTGRNILLNLCNWGEDLVHTVSSKHIVHVLAIGDSLQLIMLSGECPFPTRGVSQVTYTIPSRAQTICVLATAWRPAMSTASHQAHTVQFSSFSTKSLHTRIAVSLVAGAISTCLRLAKVA